MKLDGFKERTGKSFSQVVDKRNLTPFMFEWIQTGPFKKILHYKSLWVDGCNYSPHFVSYDGAEEFYFSRGKQFSIGFPMYFGFVYIEYPPQCMVRILGNPSRFPRKDVVIPDDTDVLEVDYSPEAIERGERERTERIQREKEERERKEFEEMKAKILEAERKKALRKAAREALKKEGKI